jgi:hypothetical protein
MTNKKGFKGFHLICFGPNFNFFVQKILVEIFFGNGTSINVPIFLLHHNFNKNLHTKKMKSLET